MVKCENSGGKGDSAVDFFSTEKKTSVHFVPCKVACENCRAPLFDEVCQVTTVEEEEEQQ